MRATAIAVLNTAQVARRSTQKLLDGFRGVFAVADRLDKAKRTSDMDFDIKYYAKVDNDFWTMIPLREWYNPKLTGLPPYDAAAGALAL